MSKFNPIAIYGVHGGTCLYNYPHLSSWAESWQVPPVASGEVAMPADWMKLTYTMRSALGTPAPSIEPSFTPQLLVPPFKHSTHF